MICVVAAVVESGQAVERPVLGRAKKYVTNLKIATGNKEMGVAFWGHLAVGMGKVKVGQVSHGLDDIETRGCW